MAQPGPKSIDWTKAEFEYITSNKTTADISKEIGTRPHMVELKCAELGWVEKRKKYRESIMKKALVKAEAKEVNTLAKLKRAADGLVESFVRKVNASNDLSDREINNLASALAKLETTVRRLFNLPTDTDIQQLILSRERVDIERERLEIEKKRFAAVDSEGGGVIEIAAPLSLPDRADREEEPLAG